MANNSKVVKKSGEVIADKLSEARAKRIYGEAWNKWYDTYKGRTKSTEAMQEEPCLAVIPSWLETPEEIKAWMNID